MHVQNIALETQLKETPFLGYIKLKQPVTKGIIKFNTDKTPFQIKEIKLQLSEHDKELKNRDSVKVSNL